MNFKGRGWENLGTQASAVQHADPIGGIDFGSPQAYLRGVAASVRVPTTTLGLDHASSGSVSLVPSVSGRVV